MNLADYLILRPGDIVETVSKDDNKYSAGPYKIQAIRLKHWGKYKQYIWTAFFDTETVEETNVIGIVVYSLRKIGDSS